MTSIAVTFSDITLQNAAQKIAHNLALPLVKTIDETFPIYLVLTPEHLQLQASGKDAPGPVYVDFIAGNLAHRLRFGGGRRQRIGRAVGVPAKGNWRVLDVTAGLGRDAYVLASMGCDVTMLESSPIVAALLKDGLMRAQQAPNYKKLGRQRPSFLTDTISPARETRADVDPRGACARPLGNLGALTPPQAGEIAFFKSIQLKFIEIDAVRYLRQLSPSDYPDVIYMDPMFPARKKTAAVKKEMRLVKQVAAINDHYEELFERARNVAKKRLVIKRPRHSATLTDLKPDLVLTGKSSRFDVYL